MKILTALGLALAVTSATVCTAQLVRTEEIPVGKISDLYGTGSIEVTVKIPHGAGTGEKALAIRVVDSLNEYTTSIDTFNSHEVALVITNLQEMVDESAKSPDYLEYPLPEKKFEVSIKGGPKSQFGITLSIATAGTADRTEADNRQVLKDFLDLLKKGQSFLESKDDPRSEQPPSAQAPILPEATKQVMLTNSETGKSSPAAAAALADVGHVLTPEEMAGQVQAGQASKCAVITNPPGAEIYVDGNKAGISPMVFVLLKKGDTPRVVTIKMGGYKTVEKRVVPDGKIIPLGLTLEKEPQEK